MKKVTILRKWDNPQIAITVEDDYIGIDMHLESFLTALVTEVAGSLANSIVQEAGNPTLWFTKDTMLKRITAAIESGRTQQCFSEAANTVLNAVKLETSKVV